MTDNPITDIEDEKGQLDMGVMMFRIYKGAISDGASMEEAYVVVTAFAAGMFRGSSLPETDEDGPS